MLLQVFYVTVVVLYAWHMCVYVYIHICMEVCVCICIYVYTYIHIQTLMLPCSPRNNQLFHVQYRSRVPCLSKYHNRTFMVAHVTTRLLCEKDNAKGEGRRQHLQKKDDTR